MQTNTATTELLGKSPKEAAIKPLRLVTAPVSQSNLADFFHCRHGVPEHHHCVRCEEDSRRLPSFWDQD